MAKGNNSQKNEKKAMKTKADKGDKKKDVKPAAPPKK